ncbi:MAG: hypothetical protein HFG49_11105 [Lachnospiraceae bacterium]|jgi:hypothetical protein|nr:hypothetical protein [Lachnospiraceae bacterium]
MNEIVLSTLGHTWILDLDGTLVKHNGYKIDGSDSFLDGAKEFLENIPEKDKIIILTSRTEEYEESTKLFLKENGIRYHHIIFGVPYGERILINDDKPTGLKMGFCINKYRNESFDIKITENEEL